MAKLVTAGVASPGIQIDKLRADSRTNAPVSCQASADPGAETLVLQVSLDGTNWDELTGGTLPDGDGRWNVQLNLSPAVHVRVDPTSIGAFAGDVDIA